MEDATYRLDDGSGDEGNEDDERHRADANPSELNHWWGAFRFTLKRNAVSRVFRGNAHATFT